MARSLVGIGLLDPHAAQSALVEVEDALLVRGASWVDATVPDMPDLTALHEAAAGGGRASLVRVLPVGTTLRGTDHAERTVASVEIWTDRAVVRHADEVGAPGWWEFTPPPDATEQALVVQVAPGRTARVELAGAAELRTLAVRRGPVDPGTYLDRLALPRVGGDGRRLRATRRAFADLGLIQEGAGAGASDEFDGDMRFGVSGERPVLVAVEPIAGRVDGRPGYLASVELWSDHWRLVAPGASAASIAVWSAVDDRGRRYGGVPIASGVIRFDPALEPGLPVTVCEFDAGVSSEIELSR
jgi:hypothetical protein